MKEKLIGICCELFEREDITIDSKRDEIAEWDSMTHVMLIAEIEESFKKQIPFEKIDKIKGVKDLYDLLEE